MSQGADSSLATWSVPQCPFAIEYDTRVLDEIRLSVIDAFFSLPRGGAEIGGLLLGQYTAGRLTISGYQPVECEHAFGPSYTLSERDYARLQEALTTAEAESRERQPVGWYHSHTRSEIFLSDADREIHNRFFSRGWQIALVLRPHTFQPTRAGFFFREAGGRIHSESTYQEFEIAPLGAAPANSQPQTQSIPARRPFPAPQPESQPETPPPPPPTPVVQRPLSSPPPPPGPQPAAQRAQAAPAPVPLRRSPVTQPLESPPPPPESPPPKLPPPQPKLYPEPRRPGALLNIVAEPPAEIEPHPAPTYIAAPAPLKLQPRSTPVGVPPPPVSLTLPPPVSELPAVDEEPPVQQPPEAAPEEPPEFAPNAPNDVEQEWSPVSASTVGLETAPTPESALPRFLDVEVPVVKRRWRPATILLVAAGVAACAYLTRGFWWTVVASALPGRPPAVSLRVLDSNGQLQIQWDANSAALHDVKSAKLLINDGPKQRNVPLDAPHLASGAFTYARETARVEVALTVTPEHGDPFREQTTYLGRTPPAPPPAPETSAPSDDLQRQNQQLKSDLEKERLRNRKLEKEAQYLRDQRDRDLRQKRQERQQVEK
jgi:proteasome lid subunit RPN8/RPN11